MRKPKLSTKAQTVRRRVMHHLTRSHSHEFTPAMRETVREVLTEVLEEEEV